MPIVAGVHFDGIIDITRLVLIVYDAGNAIHRLHSFLCNVY